MTDIGKPLECPHCGLGEAELCTDDSRAMTHFVYCDGCGARTGYSFTKEAAIAAWNRRTPAANSYPLLVEALRVAEARLLEYACEISPHATTIDKDGRRSNPFADKDPATMAVRAALAQDTRS